MKAKAPTKFNNLCLRCTRKCKQPESVMIITCPKFDQLFKAQIKRLEELVSDPYRASTGLTFNEMRTSLEKRPSK